MIDILRSIEFVCFLWLMLYHYIMCVDDKCNFYPVICNANQILNIIQI